eukprot:3482811-Pleurochrysis_carterae.AAC.1
MIFLERWDCSFAGGVAQFGSPQAIERSLQTHSLCLLHLPGRVESCDRFVTVIGRGVSFAHEGDLANGHIPLRTY